MSLRIAFDLDGVLADMDGALIRHAQALFEDAAAAPVPAAPRAGTGDPGDPEDDVEGASDEDEAIESTGPTPARLSLTPRQQKSPWRHIRSLGNFWETLDELESGVLARLAAVASERRWEVIFLTSRPPTSGETTQVQTQRWLESKGFARPSVYVVKGSRGLIAAALDLDAVIDDRMENCMDVVADSKARAVLVWREGAPQTAAAARRLGIGVVGSTAECLDVLAQIAPATPDRVRTIDRVMRLLGLGDPA